MSCQECSNARESSGYRIFDPLCLWCGVRLIQMLRTLDRPAAEIAKRQRVALADWEKQGHSREEMLALVGGPLALEPVTKSAKAK
jgi:hypothetical protein